MNETNELIRQLAAAKKNDPKTFERKFFGKTPEEVAISLENKKKYLDKVRNMEEKKEIDFPVPLQELKRLFTETFKSEYGVDLIVNKNNAPILDLISRYFAKDDSFNNNTITINIPSLEKGLLIIGDYGCGKTSMINTFHKIGHKIMPNKNLWFVSTSTLELVDEFEAINEKNETTISKDEFFKKYNNVKHIYFDDFGTEENASNYGKKNLMKDILEKRYIKQKTTYLTTNLSLTQIKEKYGPRVFDRLQEQFNIIQFTGTSFRK